MSLLVGFFGLLQLHTALHEKSLPYGGARERALLIGCVSVLPLYTVFCFSLPGLTHLLLSCFLWMDSELSICTPGVDSFLLLAS